VAKYYDFDKDFLIELEPCSTHYEMYPSGHPKPANDGHLKTGQRE
jgi:hypothetical protein